MWTISNSQVILMCAIVVASLPVFIIWERAYWRENLAQWAKKNDFFLDGFRSPKFLEAPIRWLKRDNEITFRVNVRARNGDKKEGWVTFSCWYPFASSPEFVSEKWD